MTLLQLAIRSRVAPIPPEFLRRVRVDGRDHLDQQVKRVTARGGEPCRDALRRALPGEELILASFSPFTVTGPYKEYGPVFVLAHESPGSVDREWLPIGQDDTYLRDQFVIRAYSKSEEIIDAALVDASRAQVVVDELFAREETAFLHARFPTYGCFACRLDRT